MFRFRLQVCTSMGGLTITTSCCCAIRAKAPVGRVPTNPSLKAGVSDGLIVRLSSRRSLNWALALTALVLSLSKCLIFKVSDNKLVQIIYCQSLSLYFIQMKVEIKHKGIVYVHQQKYSIGDLIRRLRLLWDIAEQKDMANHVEFL